MAALTERAAAAATPADAPEGILRRQSLRESAARTYARSLPIVPVRARGLTIEGADGRRYLDCLSGAGTLALGHNHLVVLEAIRKVLDSGAPLHVLDLATPVKDAFTTELFAALPPRLAADARIQFCGPAGTDAVEAALTLVRTATGRTGLLAFTGGYHGMTAGALAASGGSRESRATRLPYPQDYRCPFGAGGPEGAELAARWTEHLLDDPKGNQLAMAAGAATLSFVRRNALAERAAALGHRMLTALHGLAAGHPCIGDVRGRGLMIGLEFVDPDSPDHAAAPALAAAVRQACLDRGLIVELGGRHCAVVRLLPPLTLTDEQTVAVLDRLADAVAAADADRTRYP
ncbi:aminotransferase class III-fold pyridoxal phosphate-dependent enzyme [Streptomyces sp. NPDC002054]|uniref:aminotransferase class III-fold pyridoxal phosphate-dependent enzyme n=1 Tax=Streptomyces sp. NPDC002054 TaxID=3154663 RepID=UPI003324D3D6